MNPPAAPRHRGTFLRRLASRSIRTKLMVLVGVLLGLGALNVGVYSWGVQQRSRVFRNLQRAIERQRIITDVTNDLENQKKFVDLLGSGILGEQAAAAGPQEQQLFAARLDSITTRLEGMPAIAEPTDRDSLALLQSQTEDLSRWWETFYANQGVDATAAVVASVRAESIAQELLDSFGHPSGDTPGGGGWLHWDGNDRRLRGDGGHGFEKRRNGGNGGTGEEK